MIIADYGTLLHALAAFFGNHDNIKEYERTEEGFFIITDDDESFEITVTPL